jgi:hypothetical protein
LSGFALVLRVVAALWGNVESAGSEKAEPQAKHSTAAAVIQEIAGMLPVESEAESFLAMRRE